MGDTFRFRTWHAAAFLAAIGAASALSSSKDARGYWRGLNRAPAAPPRWAYPAVWAGLNALQLWADLRILNRRDGPDRKTLLGLRAVNWMLSAVFAPSVLGAKPPVAGEAVTLAEGVTSGATMALLARSDPLAAAALAPLTLWLAYNSLTHAGEPAKTKDSLVDRLRWQGAF